MSMVFLLALPVTGESAPAGQDDSVDHTGSGALVLGATEVNVRDCASFDCESVGKLLVGDRVTVTGPEEDGFLPVESGASGLAGYAWALYISIDGRPAPWLQQGTAGCKRVALAFNIGVGDPFDYGILDTLQEYEVPATFFAMGWTTDRDPATVQAIADAGFPIGTHGYDAIDLPTTGDYDLLADLRASIDSIRAVAGDNWVPYSTPYAASTDERVRTLISGEGLMPVGWGIAADDYAADADPNAIWDRVVPDIYDGAIIEMHIDAPNSANSTGVALPWVIQALEDQGYEFVTVPDMALPCGVTTASLDAAAGTPVAATPAAGTPTAGTPDAVPSRSGGAGLDAAG
jgi:peptidoglycan/xylan/chitin deacetylase (PgdA/CDA1 family)